MSSNADSVPASTLSAPLPAPNCSTSSCSPTSTAPIESAPNAALRFSTARIHYVAQQIAGAVLIELPGSNHGYLAPDQDELLDEIERFIKGAPGGRG
jgi:hypothetical protein